MLIFDKKLNNTTGNTYEYVVEQLARVKIQIDIDGTIKVFLINDENWDENFIQIASLSTGIPIKQ